MNSFIFKLQRFADDTVDIPAGETYERDGVTYTAITDAQLTLDADEKVSGIASGSVTATATGATDSPKITFKATDSATNFTATGDGSIIAAIVVLPIEFISGNYTFDGTTLDISAGSDFVIVDQKGNFSLRNENIFVYDGTYTFSGATMTSDCERVISHFTLSNGTDTRELLLEQRGKVINNFLQRGFTLVKGSSEVMNIGNYTITATAINDDAGLNIELGEKGIILVPNQGDGALNVSLSRDGTEIFAGELECTSGEITFGYDNAVTFAEGTSFDFKWNDYVSRVTTTAEATVNIELTADGKISFTPGQNDGGLNLLLFKGGTPIFAGELNITDGTITFDAATQKFSFTEGTKIALGIGTDGSQEMDFEVVGGDASFKIVADSSGNFTITPDENDGTLDVTLKRDGETVFQNNISINGAMVINPVTDLLTLKDGTTISAAFNNYTLTATADGDASSTVALTANGISITPQTGDGTLELTLSSADGSINANIEILSGGFLFGTNGALSVTEGTELQIDFGDGYIIGFKATDAAGGTISLGADGITFAPNSADGGLQLSVTRNGQTRSASLDVTGSITYKLDGSISLTQGTVVRNVFDSGNILTITANTDASGSIVFTPQNGLTIQPTMSDALNVSLTTGDLEVVNISSIDGTINYTGGVVTASEGTKAHITYYFGWESELRTEGGTASLQFTADRTVYIANEGANFVIDYLDGTTAEIQNGIYSDIYATETSDAIELVSEGSTFKTNDNEQIITLDKAGNYNVNGMNVKTSSDNVEVVLTDYDTITVNGISFHSTDENFVLELSDTGAAFKGSTADIKLTGMNNAMTIDATDGEFSFDATTGEFFIAAGTTISFVRDGQTISLTATEDISAPCKVEEDIFYFDVGETTLNVAVSSDGQILRTGELKLGEVVSYSPKNGTFGLTGANSSHGNGSNSSMEFTNESGYGLKIATNDTTVVFVPKISNGNLELNFPNERKHEMLFTLSHDGQTTFEGQVTIGGTIGFGLASQELSLRKGTVLTLVGDGENSLKVTALDDAGGQLTFTDGGIRFAPNAGDGQLELNFVSTNRKANIDVTGAIVYGTDRNISLEKGTVVNLAWEDGVNLKMTATDDGGSIGFDQQGLKVSGNGELSIDLKAGDLQTTLSNLSGTIHYNAGKVLFDEDAKITATSTLGGQPVNITLESNGEGGYVEISANGTNYVAGTGPLQITWARDGKESTFAISNGSVYIGHGIFQIAEGTELSTDLKDLVPALYFTTTDAGEYTINGQTITTSATNMAMTATDDRMTFTPAENVVGYDGMTFTGDGNVSLTKDGVILGAGIKATGFGTTNTFILTEQGTVTADGKTFELTEDVPTGVSVTGAQDGFTFARTITAQSEERLGIKDSPDIGNVFTEKFAATGDDYYRIQTDLLGLQQIIGMTSPVTIDASADVAGKSEETIFDIVTDSEGTFTIGEKPYTISGDSSVAIKGIFNTTIESCARGFDDLNGTVRGDFTEHPVTINGGSALVIVHGDDDIAIAVNESGAELYEVSDGATLESYSGISKAHTDGAGKFVLGSTADDSLLVQTGDAATFQFDEEEYIIGINDIGLELEGNLSHVSAYDEMLFVHGMQDGKVVTDAPEKVWTQMTGASMTLNGNELTLTADDDGIWIKDKSFTGLDEGATLKVSEAGTYSTTLSTLDAKAGDLIVGLYGDDAYIYDENNPLITRKTPNEDIVKMFNPNEYGIIGDDGHIHNVTLEGGDLVVIEDTPRPINVVASNKTDTVVSQGKRVNVSMTGGNTWLFPIDGKMTLQGYDASTGSGFGTTFTDIVTAIDRGLIDFDNGKLTLGAAEIDMGTDNLLINFFDREGDLLKVGSTSKFGELDASTETNDLLVIAEPYSTIHSGSGNDSVYGDVGNFIDAGAGNNFIAVPTKRDQSEAGATIDITKGTNTVANFYGGFDNSGDIVENSSSHWDNLFDGKDVIITTDHGKTTLEGVGNGEPFVLFKEAANGVTYNVAVAQKDSVIALGSDLADVYVGENSGVDFTGYDGTISIDLDERRGKAVDSNVYFYGINKITAGDGLTTLIGSAGNDTLTAGTSKNKLWGNWGNDLLIGNTSADKEYATEFFFGAGDGHDTISNFEFIATDKALTSDKINTGTSDINNAILSGSDVVIEFDNDSTLRLTDAAGKDFQINDMIAKVDRNITFDGVADCYVADGGTVLTVDSTVTDAEIWLDNSHDAKFFGNILTVDASAAQGNTSLVGNEHDNTIIAGRGDSSMWGGMGNDLLVGGGGRNTFFYLLGNGNDTISGTTSNDEIALSDITLDQIAEATVTDDGALLRFTDGGSLTINGTADVTAVLADGSKFTANHEQRQWSAK